MKFQSFFEGAWGLRRTGRPVASSLESEYEKKDRYLQWSESSLTQTSDF
jgi:hypothetical protein